MVGTATLPVIFQNQGSYAWTCTFQLDDEKGVVKEQ